MDGPSYITDYTCTCDAIAVDLHVHYDVVTDWSYALAGFLVSMLFGVSPSNFSHCKCFSIRIPFLFQYRSIIWPRSIMNGTSRAV